MLGGARARAAQARARTPSWPRSWRARRRSPTIPASRPTSWRRSARCACARSTTPRARWRPSATRSSATRSTRARARALHELRRSRRDARGRARRAGAAGRARGDYEELVALYEHRLGLHDDRAERAHWLRKIAEVCDRAARRARARARRARARAEGGADAGRGARRHRAHRGRGQAAARRGARGSRRCWRRRRAGRRARAGAARGAPLRAKARRSGVGGAALPVACSRATPRTSTRCTALEAYYRAAGDDGARWRRSSSGARRSSSIRRRASALLDGGGAAAREARRDLGDAIAALQTLRAAEEGDAEVLGELARLLRGDGPGRRAGGALAERARFTEDPRERAALWARVGELRLGMLNDLDGAAEAYREALEGAPEDPIALAALEAIEERREDWSTLQEVLMRRLGAASGADQIAVLLKLARNAEQKLSDARAGGRVPAPDPRRRRRATAFAYLELERLLRAGERWYDLVDVLGKHADAEGAAGRKPTELALRVAIADVWEQELDSPESAAEALEKVLEVAPTNVAGAAVAGAPARGRRALGRRGRGAGARGGARGRTRRRPPRSSSATRRSWRRKEADPAEIERALLRALDADPTHRPDAGGAREDGARRRRTTSGSCSSSSSRSRPRPTTSERKTLLAEIAALYTRPLGAARRRCRTWSGWWRSTRTRSRGARAAGRRAASPRAASTRRRGSWRELIEQLTKARRGKDAARWHKRLGMLAEARGDLTARGRELRRRVQARSRPPRDAGGAGPARVPRRRPRARAQVLPLAAAAELRRGDRRRLEGRGLPDARPHARRGQRDPEGAQHVRARPRDRSQERRPARPALDRPRLVGESPVTPRPSPGLPRRSRGRAAGP